MVLWQEVADDLRRRIWAGEFPIDTALPPISQLQNRYGAASLNTIMRAQSLLAEEGLLDRRHGVGVFVVATSAQAAVAAVQAELKAAGTALDRAITLLERIGEGGSPVSGHRNRSGAGPTSRPADNLAEARGHVDQAKAALNRALVTQL